MDQLQLLLARHVEAENAHDMPATLATLHPDCVFEDTALQLRFEGRDGARRYYQTWWDAFALKFKRGEQGARHMTVTGSCIAEGMFYGRHVGSFYGLAPSHADIEFRFAVVVAFRDGLMSGERFYYDSATLLTQIGAQRSQLVLPATGSLTIRK